MHFFSFLFIKYSLPGIVNILFCWRSTGPTPIGRSGFSMNMNTKYYKKKFRISFLHFDFIFVINHIIFFNKRERNYSKRKYVTKCNINP